MERLIRTKTLDDIECFDSKISRRAIDLFKENKRTAPLKVSRVFMKRIGEEFEEGEVDERTCFVRGQEVWDEGGVKDLKNSFATDTNQVFTLPQRRSWTSLPIPYSLLKNFLDTYSIFAPIWKILFTFGPKIEENEFEFPTYRARHSRPTTGSPIDKTECAYMLRRVELNGRGFEEGHTAWSIRQTGVYHQSTFEGRNVLSPSTINNNNTNPKSIFLLIAPSTVVATEIDSLLETVHEDPLSFAAANIHRVLVADALQGWLPYMACLERCLKDQSNRIICANVGSEKENLSPLTDIHVSFTDRQELKILEDMVLDLQVILPTLLGTIRRISESLAPLNSWSLIDDQRFMLEDVREEFTEYIREAEMLVERAKVLDDRAHSTSKLLSDLLALEEAVALKQLALESQKESQSMFHLTERSTKDAAGVKIITVITLIYLPTTIVANFFSTQFIRTLDNGDMQLSNKAWLLAAISIPLTLLTIALWVLWVRFTKLPVLPSAHPLPMPSTTQRQSSLKIMAQRVSSIMRRIRTP